MSQSDRYYGKYRGVVTTNEDPNNVGRIKAQVPAFSDSETGWATPSTPYGGNGVGMFFIPPVGANVWIEYEGGDPELPIWSGCFWDQGEAPADSPDIKIIKTDFAKININDASGSGEITIEGLTGVKIVLDSDGIELSYGATKIKLTAASVDINDGAFEVI
jgi:uncharacterized protein involved in type VI secretion and phage assembly